MVSLYTRSFYLSVLISIAGDIAYDTSILVKDMGRKNLIANASRLLSGLFLNLWVADGDITIKSKYEETRSIKFIQYMHKTIS